LCQIIIFLKLNNKNDDNNENENEEEEQEPADQDTGNQNYYNDNYPKEETDSFQKIEGGKTKEVTVIGGPKKNPADFKEKISFQSEGGFSGILYKYKDSILKNEEEVIYDSLVRKERDFPGKINYSGGDQELELDSIENIGDNYVALYKGTVFVENYYQFYRGILRK
jgi:hypothetical protein